MSDGQPGPAEESASLPEVQRPGTLAVLLVALLFVGLLLAMFLVGYIPYRRQLAEARADAAERSNAVPSVGVSLPRETAAAKDILLPADIRPERETAIYPRTSGYLKKLYVDINDRVKAGQLLAEIDTPEIDAQLLQSKAALQQARANVTKAQADTDLAAKTLARYQQLPPGAASAEDQDVRQAAYDDAVAALAQARANVGVAEADVQRLTVLQGFEKVTAPFAGTITARGFDLGALLSASSSGREMFRLTQSDPLRVDVYLPQVYASEVKLGEAAFLSVRNYPGRQFQGVVSRSADSLSDNSRTMLLQLSFANPDGQLLPGMYGQVRLAIARQQPVLLVPTSAMIFGAAGTQVITVKDDKVHLQTVSVGRDLGTEIEVLSGLSAHDEVVSRPSAQITEGMAVQPIRPRTAQASATVPPDADE